MKDIPFSAPIPQTIAIIGGGFSGVALLRALIDRATNPLILHLFDRAESLAKGLAYHTMHPAHLLNVPAAKMGAFVENPAHFWEWLSAPQTSTSSNWREQFPELAVQAENWQPSSFVPRVLIGIYLREIYEQTVRLAEQKRHRLFVHNTVVQSIQKQAPHLVLVTESSHHLQVDRIVLATGHPESRQLSGTNPASLGIAYLADLWDAQADSYWPWFAEQNWTAVSHAVILGAGLSAIDMLYSLAHSGFPGKITMLSRSATLPQIHQSAPQALATADIDAITPTAQGIVDYIHSQTKALSADMRDVVDSLRPITNVLWQRLPLEEQQRFIREHFAWWNVIRHRMPQASADLIVNLQASGKLQLRAGHLKSIDKSSGKLALTLQDPHTGLIETIPADTVLNAMGYVYDLTKTTQPLLVNLREQEMLVPNPLGMGLLTDGQHRVQGKAQSQLYAMGPLLYGERLESTAVPDLRQHAAACAESLLRD